jgi:GNAT superfamily N-acetyltransferase
MTSAEFRAADCRPLNQGELRIVEVIGQLPPDFPTLLAQAEQQGHDFVGRFFANWSRSNELYGGPGEGLFAAYLGKILVGMAAIAADPYAKNPAVGRLRHVFVMREARGKGVASALVATCLERGRRFGAIRLRTGNPDAARIYERFGFVPVDLKDASHVLLSPTLS